MHQSYDDQNKERYNTLKLEIPCSNFTTSSSQTTSYSEEELNPHWEYDTWEISALTKKIKKQRQEEGIDEFLESREQRKVEKSTLVPPLNLKICAFSSLQDTNPPVMQKLSSGIDDSTIIYRNRKKEEKQTKSQELSIQIHHFSNSARLSSQEREKVFFETLPRSKSVRVRNKQSKRNKSWKSFAFSGRRASKSFLKVKT